MTIYDYEQGETEKESNLCLVCLSKAKKEGVGVKEIE